MAGTKIVDVDGHVMEPADLWVKNIEPRFRDRALRVKCDAQGLEFLEIDGRRSRVVCGGFIGSFGTLDADVKAKWAATDRPGGAPYEESVPPGARDMKARLKWMDHHGIDIALLYPSLSLSWQNECEDPELAAAYCRVYNDWLTDLCNPHAERLVPVALVPLLRIEEAVAELRRASDLGAKGLYAFSIPPNGISYGDPYYDPLWAECQDRQIPIGIHVSNTPLHSGREYYEGGFGANSWFFTLMYNPDCQIAFTSFFQGGALERFPHLSVGVVETGCGWIAHWVELMDAKYKMNGHDQMQRPPSEYFERQCWISGEPHERSFAHMAQLMGSHKLMWGSDYPHEEGHDNPVVELQETLSKLSSADVTKILGANALQTYAIG